MDTNSIVEINVGIICHSMPIVLVPFVGHLAHLGNSLGSWVRERRERRHGSDESYSNLTAPDDSTTPQLPEVPSRANLTGMRTFVRNLYRSGAQTSRREETTLPTFNELTSADLSYHIQLKSLQPNQNEDSHASKHEITHSQQQPFRR